MRIRTVRGSSRDETLELCFCATLVGVAVCEPYGQTEDLARAAGTSSLEIDSTSDLPDMQRCFPLRRQQAAASFPVSARAIGAAKLQAISERMRLETIRRMIIPEP